ncbi:MAG: ABC transporter permease subunit [Halobaculum sp.]
MRLKWFVIRRAAWVVIAAWAFLTATFLVLALTRDPNITFMQFVIMRAGGGAEEQRAAAQAYLASRGRTGTLWERYVRWLRRYVTLSLGRSAVYERPVTAVLATRVPVTLGYLLPSVAVASVASVVSGIGGAVRKGSWFDRTTNFVSYLGLGVPMFAAGVVIVRVGLPTYNPGLGYFATQNLFVLGVAAVVVGLNLYAVQSWAIRAEAVEIVPAEFVKTVRADGASDTRIGRHVLKNALAPVFALLVSELLVVLFVGVYVVELVFDLPGAAAASFRAFRERDFALTIATVVLPVFVALLVNFLLEVISAVVDPRVAGESE